MRPTSYSFLSPLKTRWLESHVIGNDLIRCQLTFGVFKFPFKVTTMYQITIIMDEKGKIVAKKMRREEKGEERG